jgi:glycosyltransferase involved in cell wall biosynthesis
MKVLLDPQIFQLQKYGGISRLFVELWKHSLSHPGFKFECPLLYSENYHLKESGLAPKNIFGIFNYLHFKGTGRIKDLLKSMSIKQTKKKIRTGQADIFIATYYDPYFLDDLKGKPFILTVYDMIHELFPQYFHHDKQTISNKKLLIEKADSIVAISEKTKKDILQFYPATPPEKIKVVYLSQSIQENATTKLKELPEKYILFVGNRQAYKNFALFAEAAKVFLKSDSTLHIVCAGGGKLRKEEISLLNQLGIQERTIQLDYEDNELSQFYKRALMFVFPSAYEGFGIPTLEAMKCGCPVILSKSSCLPEIGGDAAIYFESGNLKSLVNAIGNLLTNLDLRNEMVNRGLKRVNDFSWAKTAEGYYSIINEVVSWERPQL